MTVLILFCIKKEPLQALLNGGRGGIRTRISPFCAFNLYFVTYNID